MKLLDAEAVLDQETDIKRTDPKREVLKSLMTRPPVTLYYHIVGESKSVMKG